MLTSGKSYDILRDSGFICLPSRCTLRDYTYWLKLKPGFNSSVIYYLMMEAKIDTYFSKLAKVRICVLCYTYFIIHYKGLLC